MKGARSRPPEQRGRGKVHTQTRQQESARQERTDKRGEVEGPLNVLHVDTRRGQSENATAPYLPHQLFIDLEICAPETAPRKQIKATNNDIIGR